MHFANTDIHTPGDSLNCLVVMNPAALKTNIKDLLPDGILIVNSDSFGANDLAKAKYANNPLEDGSLKGFRIIRVPIDTLNREAVKECNLAMRDADRCKNFFALGLVFWMFERSLDSTIK